MTYTLLYTLTSAMKMLIGANEIRHYGFIDTVSCSSSCLFLESINIYILNHDMTP